MSEFIGLRLGLEGADKTQADLRAVGAGLKGLGAASDAGARKATESLGSMGMSANATAAALRNVPAQFTDIVVSLQSGQAPLTVLLQQGGQLKDMFGGIVPAARALGGYVVGLINPITLLAGGVAALALAYHKGSQEQDAFQRAITMTGNRAGITASALADMARAMSQGGHTQSAAADALAQLAETGRVGLGNLQGFAAVAMDLEKSAGIPIKNTVKDFAELGKAPVEASIKLNEQYGYLTTATLAQIKALQEEGRAAEAAALAQRAFASGMADNTREIVSNLGALERGWNAIVGAAKRGWDAMLGIGRQDTLEQKIAAQQEIVARAEKVLAGNGFATSDGGAAFGRGGASNAKARADLERARGILGTLTAQRDREQEDASQTGKFRAVEDAGIAAMESIDKRTQAARTNQEKLTDALKDYRRELDALRAANPRDERLDPAAIAKVEANLRKQYADKSGGAGIAPATRRLDLSELQAGMRQEQAMVRQQQQQLDIQRGAGLVSLQDYYAQQRALIEKGAKVETDALQAQLDRLEAEKTKGVDALNVQRQIVATRGQLDVRQIQTQNELAAADQRSARAIRQHESAMRQLTVSQGAYIDQLRRRADEQVASEGMGERRRAYTQGLSSIRENYLQQVRQLEDQRGTAATWTPENEAYYQERLRLLRQQQEAEVAIYGDTYSRINAMQADWRNGAIRAMEDYGTSTANIAQQTAAAFSNAMRGMEDALVQLVMTGKADFKSLASSIIADIVRIQARAAVSGIFSSLVGGVVGMFGGRAAPLASSGVQIGGVDGMNGYAKGGVFDSPSLSLYRNQVLDRPTLFAFAKGGVFGEAGPEAIMPLTRGPDGNLGVRSFGGDAAGGITVNVPVSVVSSGGGGGAGAGSEGAMASLGATLSKAIAPVVKETIEREKRPGGSLWNWANGRA